MNYQGGLFMSKKEQLRFAVIDEFRQGRLTRRQAGWKLNISERQVSRLTRKVREKSIEGIKHGNHGRCPDNKKSEEVLSKYVELYRERYFDFNYSHAMEMIAMHHQLEAVSYTRFRKACRQAGLGKVKKRRTSRARIARERAAEEGFMLQMDGSPHKWNGDNVWSLVSVIDDASSDVPSAGLFASETTWACMKILHRVVAEKGIPHFILTDKAGWSSGAFKRQSFTQFERACRELGITVITANSAETKGRIERLNRTFQDRLIPELRLYGIKTQKDANRFLEQSFLPSWRQKFTVQPRSEVSRYQPLDPKIDLKEVFCMKYSRVVNRDHTIAFKGKCYRLNPANFSSLKGREVTVNEYEDQSCSVNYGGRKVPFEIFKRPQHTKWRRWA